MQVLGEFGVDLGDVGEGIGRRLLAHDDGGVGVGYVVGQQFFGAVVLEAVTIDGTPALARQHDS